MSYTPTEWESTDVVTATRMNALEQAVGDMNMSYTPNTWSDGDILSAEKMNALEQAVASGGGGSSDFSTAEVTVSCVGDYYWPFPALIDGELVVGNYMQAAGTEETHTVVLYKGKVTVFDSMATEVVSGSATLENAFWTITGNCILSTGIY